MILGVDYYPEHWNPALWRADADLMRQSHVRLVRLAEFSWCRLEPRDGAFDFGWLDEVVGLFAERGIKVVLCTPTNCPPLWFYEKYPDSVQTERDGRKTATGIRGHRCLNNADFLRYADRIVDVMTRHYAGNPAVVAWQIDNEVEANFCFCDTCVGKYRNRLKKKYGTLEALNKAYGNNMWSGEYSSWEQIKPPYGSYPYAWLNPAYMLDFCRHASEDMVEYLLRQADIIRKNCPGVQITTNAWFCSNLPNFYEEFAGLDFVSYDNYPTTRLPDDPEECYSHAFHLDLMRGVKRDNFCVMEQLSGGLGCWAPMARTPYPGMIKGYSLQAFAHGADTVVHFRWRSAVSGAEMHWHGLIDHSNVPGRRFEEFRQLGEEAKKLLAIRGTRIQSKVAILYSPEDDFAFRIQPQTNGMYYLEQPMLFHAAFTGCGVNVDVVSPKADLSDYRVVVAPELYLTEAAVVQSLYDFAEKGGTVVLTVRSGVKDPHNNCIMEPLPTAYRKLVGAYVEEYDPIGYDKESIVYSDGSVHPCRQWCDILHPEGAQAIASYQSGFYQGKPAIVQNRYGAGYAYYVGTVCTKSLYGKLAKDILRQAKVPFLEGLPANVEVTTRTGEGLEARFMFNNTDKVQEFDLNGEHVTLAAFEMKIDLKR